MKDTNNAFFLISLRGWFAPVTYAIIYSSTSKSVGLNSTTFPNNLTFSGFLIDLEGEKDGITC